jgi:flagellar basal-body rod protein FlgG
MRSLSIAASGMSAQNLNVEVIANNIANSNTTAFKRGLPQFADLIYQVEKTAGVPNQGNAGGIPETEQVGLGVQTVAISTLNTQGPLTQTGNQLDVALSGRGWFQVQGPNNQTLYTRAGNFGMNAQGQLVTQDGYQVLPSITFPTGTTTIQINTTGAIFAGNGGPLSQVGQMQIATFVNDAGLQALGNNLYQETAAAGNPQVQNPGNPGCALTQQFYLEGSNVDPVQEITNLITAQRNYEMNGKVITAADEMWQVITKNNL